jgi:hypothetical protein
MHKAIHTCGLKAPPARQGFPPGVGLGLEWSTLTLKVAAASAGATAGWHGPVATG